MHLTKRFPVYAFTATLLCGSLYFSNAAEEPESVSRVLEGERLNEIGVWDLGNDSIYEVFVSGVSGKAGCYRVDTLEPLWEKKISKSALTAPVIGDFMGTGAPVLAFGASTGEVFFVWPATGEVISTLETQSGFTLPPAVATFGDLQSQAVVLADDSGQLVVADLSPDGLPRVRWLIPNSVKDSTAFSVLGQFAQPPSCNDLNDDGTPEIVTTSESGILQVVSLQDEPTRDFTRLPQQSRATTYVALGTLSDSSVKSILIGIQANLQMFEWDAGNIKQVLASPAFGNSHGHILFATVNADPIPDLVTSADTVVSARYLGNDLNGNQVFLDIAPRHLTTTAAPLTPAIVCKKPDGSTALLSIDGSGAVIEWQPAAEGNPVREIATIPVPTGFTPAGNFVGNGKLTLVTWMERGTKLSAFTLPVDVARDTPPMLTIGSNYSRNGQWGGMEIAAQQQRAAAALAAAKAAYQTDAEESELTTTPASIISGIAPSDPIAQELAGKRARFSRKVLLLSLVLSLTGIAAVGLLWHYYRKRH